MPACASENLTHMWSSSESVHVGESSSSSGFHSPGSPYSSSPLSTSPDGTLKKRLRRTSSSGSIERFVIQSDRRDSRCQSPVESLPEEDESFSILASIIGWYPCFLLRVAKGIIFGILPLAWRQILFAIPMWSITLWIWMFWQIIQLPLTIFKAFMTIMLTPSSERNRKKRTVLISGGSTIQALHLARNFYSAGARVVVCEVEGHFALARFSIAVNKFYTVPKPNSEHQQNYVRALCEIAEKERVSYYIPVSSSTSAYYDAVAKPHLELLGCSCFCPGIKEVWALDDTLELLRRCDKAGIPTPIYHTITSKDNILNLYESGEIRTGRFVMSTAGLSGLRERSKIVLPLSRNDLKLPQEINDQKPWVVVQHAEGDQYLTCTTVKDSKVIANVTCLLKEESHSLVPVENKEVTQWLNNFFSKLNLMRPLTGHVSFRFLITKNNNTIVPLSSRVGVTLPYICYTTVHPRLVWKPCRHFSRQNSGPLTLENGRYWMPETMATTLRNPTVENVTRLIGTVLDKREVLFTMWDPLPYCAYYHMQLPFKNVLGFVQKQQDRFPLPVAAPVR